MAGVDETGLTIKTFNQIIDSIQETLDDGDTGIVITDESNKIANNLANSIALALTEIYQFGEEVYNSANVYKATGTSLDKLVTYRRLVRLPAEFSSGKVEIFCSGKTLVNNNTRFRDTRGRNLVCTENRTLGTSLFRTVSVTLGTVTTGSKYYIIIAGTEYSYTTSSGDDDNDVLLGIKNNIDNNSGGLYTTDLTDSILSVNVVAPSNVPIAFHPDMVLGDFSSLVSTKATDTGPLNFPANSVNTLVNPVSTIISINNPVQLELGRDLETDSELRSRFLRTPAATREATVDSILRAVDGVDGVISTNLINNPTSSVSVDGLPPHSYEVIVDGGEDEAIANIIFQRGAAGIQAYGSTTVVVSDSKGIDNSIGFTRPTNVYIFFRVTYEPLSTGSVPSNIETLIKDNVVEYAGELSTSDDIIPSRFTVPLYNNITGLGEVLVEVGSSLNEGDLTPTTGYSTDRIVLDIRERSVIESARISVIENPLP